MAAPTHGFDTQIPPSEQADLAVGVGQPPSSPRVSAAHGGGNGDEDSGLDRRGRVSLIPTPRTPRRPPAQPGGRHQRNAFSDLRTAHTGTDDQQAPMGDNAPCEHPRSPIEGIRYSRRSARVNPKHHPAFILITTRRPRTRTRLAIGQRCRCGVEGHPTTLFSPSHEERHPDTSRAEAVPRSMVGSCLTEGSSNVRR